MTDDELEIAVDRIEGLLTALVRLQTGVVLEQELKDDFDRQLYELTGEATTREIQKKLKAGPNRISDTWKRWERLGLVIKDGKTYRRTV